MEDNAVVHARPGETCTIGYWVTLGHGCVVHNVKLLGDYAVVGMNAVVSDWAEVGEWGVVAEGAVVRQRAVVPAARIAAGVPARLLDREVDEEYRAAWRGFKQIYVDLCARYARATGAEDDDGAGGSAGLPPRPRVRRLVAAPDAVVRCA